MRETKHLLIPGDFPAIRRTGIDTLQINLGYKCNQSCTHCHVNAGPNRTEMMSDATLDIIFDLISTQAFKCVDLTGGAPELHSRFRDLVSHAREHDIAVRDRCNLTILFEPNQEDLATFLAKQQVEIIASLPCYTEKNVDLQRGKGVFADSILGLQLLNQLGYGKHLPLHLVYNPAGPTLPPSQQQLQRDYTQRLAEDFNIKFNELFVITNMPIQRFGSNLLSSGHFDSYLDTLRASHLESNLVNVMCKNTISIDWQGNLYDCDFNQMLEHPITDEHQTALHIRDLSQNKLEQMSIKTGNHCYGCTAGQGSSCSGALNAV